MAQRQQTEDLALLLSRVVIGEADLVVHLFTREHGKLSALARGARRSQKRFGGALEPLHTLNVHFEEKGTSELVTLKEATLARPRLGLTSDLERMDAAGRALTWVRKASRARTSEPSVFSALELFLDALDRGDAPDRVERESRLLGFGLTLLETLGFGLELVRCVSCGKACPSGTSAWVTPERGGIVCRACGGGPILLGAPLRTWMLEALAARSPALLENGRDVAFTVLERAIEAHIAS